MPKFNFLVYYNEVAVECFELEAESKEVAIDLIKRGQVDPYHHDIVDSERESIVLTDELGNNTEV